MAEYGVRYSPNAFYIRLCPTSKTTLRKSLEVPLRDVMFSKLVTVKQLRLSMEFDTHRMVFTFLLVLHLKLHLENHWGLPLRHVMVTELVTVKQL